MDIEMPDGTVVTDVPEGTTKAQLMAKIQAHTSAPKMSAGDVASGAAKNFLPSAMEFGKQMIQPILHPLDTGKALLDLGAGVSQKMDNAIAPSWLPHKQGMATASPQQIQTADAAGKFYADRYGGLENIKHTMAQDPVGFLADASIPLTMGGSLAARAPGIVGKAAEAASVAGKAANPMAAALRVVPAAAKAAGQGVADVVGNLGTHTGGLPITTAFNAGRTGGEASEAFLSHLRGNAPLDEVISDARKAVSNVRAERGANYRAGMGTLSGDPTVLDMGPIDSAISNVAGVKNYKGVDISKSTAGVRSDIKGIVDQWKSLPPEEFHTAEGLDALKQAIGDIRDSTQYGTPERVVADNAYHAVRDQIVQQAPIYGKTMSDYAKSSDAIKEIEDTLSLKNGSRPDTALRKLQSSMRDNVNTTFGRRTDLAQALTNYGAPQLMEKLAGQSLSRTTPRGLGNLTGGAALGAALYTHNPATLATLPLQSPRLVGEAAHLAGRGAGLLKKSPVPRDSAANAALIAELLGRQQNLAGSN